jgi:hypothetical protein
MTIINDHQQMYFSYLQPYRSSFTSSEEVLADKNGVSMLHCLQDQFDSYKNCMEKINI